MPTILTRLRGLPAPVAPDEPLRRADGGAGVMGLSWLDIPTGGHTLTLDDSENGLAFYDAGSVYVNIPPASSVPFRKGASVLIMKASAAGSVNVTGGAGVTLSVRSVFSPTLAGRWALATLINYGTDQWVLSGDLFVP